jgi:hypothetical protein
MLVEGSDPAAPYADVLFDARAIREDFVEKCRE